MLYRLLLKFWLLPPVINLLLVIAGLLLLRRCRWLAGTLIVTGLLSLWVLAMPVTSNWLLRSVQADNALFDVSAVADPESPLAIVVLGGGSRGYALEYADYELDAGAASRVRYASYLHRRTGWPLLMTGGGAREEEAGLPDYPGQAELMRRFAARHFDVSTRWLENDSRTTEENATFSRQLLQDEGVQRIVLVTESMHMRRAVLLFERAGFEVIPPATQLPVIVSHDLLASWLPSTRALNLSRDVLHEYLGLLWYSIR